MAKGNGSDYENLEDGDNVNEQYCEPADEFRETTADGNIEQNYEEYGEEGDDEYRPASKRGKGSTGTRFRGRNFSRGNATGIFNSGGHFNGPRGTSRFHGSSNWDNEWNSETNNDAPRSTIPPLMSQTPMIPNNGFPGGNFSFMNSAPQVHGGQMGQEDSNDPINSQISLSNSMDPCSDPEVSIVATKMPETVDSFSLDNNNAEIWVETKTSDNKSYYYNAKSRDTTWTKPEGENVKIISQEQVEAIAAAAGVQQVSNENSTDENAESMANSMQGMAAGMGMPMMGPSGSMPPNTMQPPPGMMPPFGAPFGGPPPFGMPPPGFSPSTFPGGFQPSAPWGFPQPGMSMMPPNMMPHQQMTQGGYPGLSIPMMEPYDDKILSMMDPELLARASEWSEHRAPDGRSYFYNAKAGESVWEKPQPMKDLEAAKYAAMQKRAAMEKQTYENNQIKNSLMDAKQNQSLDKRLSEELEGDKKGEESKVDEEKRRLKNSDQEYGSEKANKKKADEEEKAAVPKVQDKSKPVSSTPVTGTPWCVVWTGDGRVFYYNPSARASVWERPEELIGRADVTKLISTPPPVVVALKKENTDESDGAVLSKKMKMNNQQEQDRSNVTNLRDESKPASVAPTLSIYNSTNEKQQINVGKEAAMEAELRAARERAAVPLETRINSFREMLAEKEVSAFSTWEKELHKIVFDPRYLLLTSKERKQIFEKYVKERAEEERQEKRNRMRQRKEDYRKLMEEANLHGKSSFSDFASKYSKDERFKNIEKMRERESLFNEFILDVRKREKDEKNHKKEQIRKDFMRMLKEHSEIDRHSRWSEVKKKLDSDSRYINVDSSSLREDYFRDYVRQLKDEKRHKEREKRREKSEKDKDKESDPELANASDAEKDKEAERAARVEASLREREKEVQRTLAVHLRDRDNEREQHKHDEAVHHFNALLADLVRNSELSWREAKRQLRKDHRWDLVELLDRDEKEKLFNEHIEVLNKKKREKFRELMDETSTITINSSWKDVRRLIKEDPRYVKFSSSDRKCEKEFKEYMKDKLVAIKSDFRELLQETKMITHKTNSLVRENDNHLKEIEDILKNDRRYLVLDDIPDERKELLLSYLEDLEKRGPPPPPTASEPSRRVIK